VGEGEIPETVTARADPLKVLFDKVVQERGPSGCQNLGPFGVRV
jgi:hypothetical protein